MKQQPDSILSRILSFISLGQYQTKLYYSNNGLAARSSRLGGMLTLLTAIIVLTFTTITLIDTLNKTKYEEDITSREIKALEVTQNNIVTIFTINIYQTNTSELSNKTRKCRTKDCRDILIKDVAPNLLNGLNFVMRYNRPYNQNRMSCTGM